MEPNWLIIIIVMIVIMAIIIFFIIRNQKDKVALEKDLIKKDGLLIPKEEDNEVDNT